MLVLPFLFRRQPATEWQRTILKDKDTELRSEGQKNRKGKISRWLIREFSDELFFTSWWVIAASMKHRAAVLLISFLCEEDEKMTWSALVLSGQQSKQQRPSTLTLSSKELGALLVAVLLTTSLSWTALNLTSISSTEVGTRQQITHECSKNI